MCSGVSVWEVPAAPPAEFWKNENHDVGAGVGAGVGGANQPILLANAPAYRLMIDGPLPSATALWAESVLRLGEEKGMASLARAARGQLAAYPPELVESAFFHATHIRLLIDQSRGRL